MRNKIAIGTLAAICLGLSSIAAAAESPQRGTSAKLYGDADRGRAIFEQWCVTCHTAGPVVDDRVPSRAALAANPASDDAIRAFLMQPHKPMPPLEISTQQIEDIIQFLQTLKTDTR